MLLIRRASVRASRTGSPLTATITSPDLMPAFAAGLPACGSATRAPSARFRPRLSAISAGDRGGRECDTARAAGRREDRGIDADHIAVDVEGRPAGIALVHRCVDLDEVVIGAGADVAAARLTQA